MTLYSLPEFCLRAISSARSMVSACIETLKRAVPLLTSTEILLIVILFSLRSEPRSSFLLPEVKRRAG